MEKSHIPTILRYYYAHLRKEWRLVVLVLSGLLMALVSEVGVFYYLKQIIDGMTAGSALTTIYTSALFVTASWVLSSAGWRIASYSIVHLELRMMQVFINEGFIALHRHSFNFFSNNFVGSLVKRSGRIVRAIETFLDLVVFELLNVLIRLALAIVLLALVHPLLGIIMFVWSAIYLSANYFASRYKLTNIDRYAIAADSKVTAQLADTVTNSTNIKLFANLPYEQSRYSKVAKDWFKKNLRSWLFSQHMELVQATFMIVLEATVLYIMIGLWNSGQMTIGDFVLIQGYVALTCTFIWDFGRSVRRLYESFADAEEMIEIIETPIEVTDLPSAKQLRVSEGKIIFTNVSFAYSDSEQVIDGLSFAVQPQETVALIGPSGGGKTTITKLLLRLYDIQSGNISIDNQNIAEVTQNSLRKHIALVPQDPILFHRSLMENIRYGRLGATDAEVLEAAKQANAHDFIMRFPAGYKTLVGERGVKLSGGERQRIAIARAILSKAEILILDEATSNLDVESEQLIQAAMRNLMKDRTTIIIAHRLSTVRNVDRIIVVNDGKIVEEGNHDQLIQQSGLYKHLLDISQKPHDVLD